MYVRETDATVLGSEGDQHARYTISECPVKTQRQDCCGTSHYKKTINTFLYADGRAEQIFK